AIEKELAELREKLATLQEIIKRQTEHIKAAEKLAGVKSDDDKAAASEPAGKPADKAGEEKTGDAALEALTIEQQETREQTEPLEKGAETIAKAGESMEKAVASLRMSRPDEGLPHQKDALELLKTAVGELKEEEKKLEAALTEEK